jgi:hypothetical protein
MGAVLGTHHADVWRLRVDQITGLIDDYGLASGPRVSCALYG